jgi:hypothetical protein
MGHAAGEELSMTGSENNKFTTIVVGGGNASFCYISKLDLLI